MALEITPLNSDFAALVNNIDITAEPDDRTVAELTRGMQKYAVLVFHDQPLTDDQHATFTRQFGPIDKGLLLGSKRKRRLENADVIDLANVDIEGQVLPPSHVRNAGLVANQLWHSDSSFKNPPAKYSILCGVDVPPQGGQTEFADQRAGYDALDEAMKQKLQGLVAEHYAFHSRELLGGEYHYSQDEKDALPPVNWPIVHTLPDSGRKSLYIGAHTREIEGMPTIEARLLLMDLLEHTTQRQFVYRHEWKKNDVLMWDNQCTLHRGRAFDLNQRREIRRCTTEVAA